MSDYVEIVRITENLTPIPKEQKGINHVFYGSIIRNDGTESRAYVKQLPPNEVFTETIASLICQSLGIPTPTPFLALIDGNVNIPQIAENEDPVFFATLALNMPTYSYEVTKSDRLVKLIEKWSYMPKSAIFDEQIGNQDRHGHNILCDRKGEFSLIDHGLAFDLEINPTLIQKHNVFAEILKESTKSAYKKVETDLPCLQKVNFPALLKYSHGQEYADNEHIKRIQRFYETRLHHIRDIFKLRMQDIDQLGIEYDKQ